VFEFEASQRKSDKGTDPSRSSPWPDLWVTMPQREYIGADGQKHYQRLLAFMDERFLAAINEAITRYLEGERGTGPTQDWAHPAF
jgi:hypothetical protein